MLIKNRDSFNSDSFNLTNTHWMSVGKFIMDVCWDNGRGDDLIMGLGKAMSTYFKTSHKKI